MQSAVNHFPRLYPLFLRRFPLPADYLAGSCIRRRGFTRCASKPPAQALNHLDRPSVSAHALTVQVFPRMLFPCLAVAAVAGGHDDLAWFRQQCVSMCTKHASQMLELNSLPAISSCEALGCIDVGQARGLSRVCACHNHTDHVGKHNRCWY